MNDQLAIDFTRPLIACGREQRDAGIERSLISAERKVNGWSEIAYGYLLEYLATHAEAFRGEQIREAAHALGCPYPAHARAWGAVMMRAAREGKIEKLGIVAVHNPGAHCANAGLWRRVI
jgi:hypothetical protein